MSFAKHIEQKRRNGLLKSLVDKIPISVWCIIPVEAILLFLLIVPGFISIWLSLVDWQPTYGISMFGAVWNWFANYIEMFTDPRFLRAFFRTFVVTAVCVGFEFLIGLGLAMLVYKPLPGRKFFSLIFILPMMFPPLVVGNNFYMLFFAEGPVNAFISYVIGKPFRLDWLSSPSFAIYTIMIADIWQWYPLMFLIMVAGLGGLPLNQLRAAEVLGAKPSQIFFRIKIPLLKAVILIALVIRSMELLKLFDKVYIMTRGGPANITETISIYMYKIGLQDYRVSYISAGAWILMIVSIYVFVKMLKPLLYRVEKFEEKAEAT